MYGFSVNNPLDKFDALGLVVEPLDPSTVKETHVDSFNNGTFTTPAGTLHTQGRTFVSGEVRVFRSIPIDSCCTQITIIGNLSVSVRILSGADYDRSRNRITVIDHEFMHVSYIATAWNAYAKIANALEGKWCGRDCAQKARDLENAAHNLYETYSALLNKHLDNWEYDRPFDGEQQQYNAAVAEIIIKTAELSSTCAKK